jgi:6,7-dimethyl-8-ribityllumazine synthase
MKPMLVMDGNEFSLDKVHVGLVVARYNAHITESLTQAAVETLRQAGIRDEHVVVVHVPGAWELPQAALPLAKSGRFAGLICLGAVIKGETTHDQHLNRAISLRLCEMSSQYDLPISLGVLMCNNVEQALQRSGGAMGNKGQEAASAVVAMIRNQLAISHWLGSAATAGVEP